MIPQKDKRELVLNWAEHLRGKPVHIREFTGPWYPEHRYPEHGQIVLGFVRALAQVVVVRHKYNGVYDYLADSDIWFDNPPDRPLNILHFKIDAWMPIPKEVLSGEYHDAQRGNLRPGADIPLYPHTGVES